MSTASLSCCDDDDEEFYRITNNNNNNNTLDDDINDLAFTDNNNSSIADRSRSSRYPPPVRSPSSPPPTKVFVADSPTLDDDKNCGIGGLLMDDSSTAADVNADASLQRQLTAHAQYWMVAARQLQEIYNAAQRGPTSTSNDGKILSFMPTME